MRSKPTKQMMLDVTGENQGLISSLHHGLYEVKLKNIYKYLDFDEAVAFAASSWKSREKDFKRFDRMVLYADDLYTIFSDVYEIGFPWLNKNKRISPNIRPKHQNLNPYRGRDLKDRLDMVDPDTHAELVDDLRDKVHDYVFHCQYESAKRSRPDYNHNLEIMNFQNVFPKRGRIVPAFASETARMMSQFPREIL